MTEFQAKLAPQRDLSRIPFIWQSTTAPEIPFSLPIGVEINVTSDSIQIHAERKGTIGELMGMNTDVDANLPLHRDGIISIAMFLMPDIPDEADWQWVRDEDLCWVVIRHRDPFEVEPYFESLFTSDKAYWPKALAKMLRERAGIDAKVTQETRQTRSVRLERSDQ